MPLLSQFSKALHRHWIFRHHVSCVSFHAFLCWFQRNKLLGSAHLSSALLLSPSVIRSTWQIHDIYNLTAKRSDQWNMYTFPTYYSREEKLSFRRKKRQCSRDSTIAWCASSFALHACNLVVGETAFLAVPTKSTVTISRQVSTINVIQVPFVATKHNSDQCATAVDQMTHVTEILHSWPRLKFLRCTTKF